jgi:hypothetical protein
VDNVNRGQKAKETQLEKYGGIEGYRAEMGRRAKLRKTIGKGGFYNPEVAKKAALKSAEVRSAKKDRKTES